MTSAGDGSRPRFHAGWWLAVTLFWTAQGLTSASQIHLMSQQANAEATWGPALRFGLTSAALWIPLTILAFAAAFRFPLARGRLLLPVAAHVAGALLVSLVRALSVVLLNPVIGWYAELPSFGALYVTSMQNNAFMYWLLVGIGHALLYAHTSRVRGEQLARAQLQALKAQLQPHFLFNALNTITSFVRDRPEMAERMIDRLARLLRQSLDSGAADEVTLVDELETLQPYLDIELARFEERLRFDIDVDDSVKHALVPHLILQPLVENAVRHGLARMAAPGVVRIGARRDGDRLELEVCDNGVGLPAGFAADASAGLGLANTIGRLEQLYGRDQSVAFARREPGTCVRVRLPFRIAAVLA